MRRTLPKGSTSPTCRSAARTARSSVLDLPSTPVEDRSSGLDLRIDAALRAAPFDELDDGPFLPLVRAALGPDAELRRRGLVVAFPGAADQAYHADVPGVPPEVFAERGAASIQTAPPRRAPRGVV
jgi:hypothetical protein